MLPATRTPEGEPFRCKVCGADNHVDVSRPPGDSVCTVCGSHAMLDNSPFAFDTAVMRANIQTSVKKILAAGEVGRRIAEVSPDAAQEMLKCLAARGLRIYVAKKRHWWSRKATMNVVAETGELPVVSVAQEVIQMEREVMREIYGAEPSALFIGVPIRKNDELRGVIEVIQRIDSGPNVRKGYLKFVGVMADVLSKCEF